MLVEEWRTKERLGNGMEVTLEWFLGKREGGGSEVWGG